MQNSQFCDFKELKFVRDYSSLVYDMTCNLNIIFGWPNAAAILCSFFYIFNAFSWISIISEWFTVKDFVSKYLNGKWFQFCNLT